VTESEALAIHADAKRIDGDIGWRPHPEVSFAFTFKVHLICGVDQGIVVQGYVNLMANKLPSACSVAVMVRHSSGYASVLSTVIPQAGWQAIPTCITGMMQQKIRPLARSHLARRLD
jgi:hypothetical protein